MFSHELFRCQSSGGDSSCSTTKLTLGWMLNNGLIDQFSFLWMSQNRINWKLGSHICCDNLSSNFKLSVVGRESHKRTQCRPCVSEPILDTYPHQPDTNNRTTKGLQRAQTVCHSRGDWQAERPFYITQTPSEIEVNTFDQQKDACSDPDQLCDSARGFHRNMRARNRPDLNILNRINRWFLEGLKDDEVSQSGVHHFIWRRPYCHLKNIHSESLMPPLFTKNSTCLIGWEITVCV